MYGINGVVLKWLKSYIANRNFKVVINNSSSCSCQLEIGVPQGSILGPLLFILYTKDLEMIVTKYGFSVHLYADDTQIYLSFDVHSDNPDLTSVTSCFKKIKEWMSLNLLKLNEDKTEFIDICIYESPLKLLALDSVLIYPSKKAKNLGFIFDHQMTLDDQVNYNSQVCYMSLRNLEIIGSKLSHNL